MLKTMMKKASPILIMFTLLILISGCETIGAVSSGEIKMEDVNQMVSPGVTPGAASGEAKDTKNTPLEKMEQVDDWIQENLW